MVKGDLRKKQILETAEALFAERGYEKTGVQDILDVLHLSKGSFYHHFESKEQVLQRICESRAEKAAAFWAGEKAESGLERMNLLLGGMIPFQREGLAFLKMILPVFVLPEGRSVRAAYQEALKRCWLPLTEDALQRMINEKQAFTLHVFRTAEIALDLVNDLWASLSEEIILSEKTKRETASPSDLLVLVEPYRAAVENIFCAPVGSIELIRLDGLTRAVAEIHDWWKIPDGEEAADSFLQSP